MSWSTRFIGYLGNGNRRPRFVLQNLVSPAFDPLGSDVYWSSHYESGYLQCLSPKGNSYRAGSLQVGDWSQTLSELTLGVRQVGPVDIRKQIAKGQLLQLRMGFPGWAVGDYEPIYSGVVTSISRDGDDWAITLRSMASVVLSRLTTTEPALFYNLAETELDADYSPGDGTVTVVSTVGAARDTDGPGNYLIQITPDSGDPFFLTATAVSGGTDFTGCSAAGVIETTAGAAATGASVKLCAYIHDHPVDAARKILASTGNAYNGDYDTLPLSWGVGVPVDALDDDDMDFTRAQVAPSGVGTPVWDVYATDAQDDGLSWLQSILGPAGLFLGERQGKLTVRAMTEPDDMAYFTMAVTDSEIIELSYETWDPDQPIEFGEVRWNSAGTGGILTVSETLGTRPAQERAVHHLDYISSDASDWRTEVSDRLSAWNTRIAEVVELRATGWRLAQLAPGDHLYINSRHYTSRTGDGNVYPLVVLAVEPDWWGSATRVRAAYVPHTAEEF